MAVKIRLSRIGKRSKPEYRIIVTETRHKNNGRFLEILGSLNPLFNPPKVTVNKTRLKYWQSVGAKMSQRLTQYLS